MQKQRRQKQCDHDQIQTKFLPAKPAATLLGMSVRRFWDFTKDPADPIPVHRFSPKLVRFYEPDLLAWAARRREAI